MRKLLLLSLLITGLATLLYFRVDHKVSEATIQLDVPIPQVRSQVKGIVVNSSLRKSKCLLGSSYSVRVISKDGIALRNAQDMSLVLKYVTVDEELGIYQVEYKIINVGMNQARLLFGLTRISGKEIALALVSYDGNPLVRVLDLEAIEKQCEIRFPYNKVAVNK